MKLQKTGPVIRRRVLSQLIPLLRVCAVWFVFSCLSRLSFSVIALTDAQAPDRGASGAFDLDTAESLEDVDFADEHPVSEQRWYTMACLMVGSNPQKYGYLVGDDGLPSARAESCPTEYQKISNSWEQLMKSHIRKA